MATLKQYMERQGVRDVDVVEAMRTAAAVTRAVARYLEIEADCRLDALNMKGQASDMYWFSDHVVGDGERLDLSNEGAGR